MNTVNDKDVVIDLTGKEHHEDGRVSTPYAVEQVKQILSQYPDAKQTIYFWLQQNKSTLRLAV